ncbi:MAG TPA: PspA/IM30 family protein [Enhygromyxa sp.]|nr:PspA/IM30 family protein [Enhygromyxa sp.]
MGLFGRLGTLIRSNINELINRAEDPEKMLNQVLVDMKGQLVEAKKQVAVAIADEKRIKKQYEQELAKAADWEKKAMMAVRAGNDDLARAALARKSEHDELAATLKDQWEAQKQSVEQLKEALRSLDAKIEEAKRKRNILVSRQKRAQAQATINKTLSQLNSTDSHDSTFARMDERVTQLEAEAEASAELGALPETSLESQFKALAAGSSVDAELEALKQKMALGSGSSGPQKAIGSAARDGDDDSAEPDLDMGEPPEDDLRAAEVDAQLEELKRKLSSS